jgi:nucleoside-diphosphate-sugar epimerase
MKNDKVLVTGAGGFIGSWVCRKICKKYSVIAAVDPFSDAWRLDDIKKDLIIEKINLNDSSEVENLIKKYKPYSVLHLATHGVYSYQQKDIYRIIVDNYLMLYNLLDSSLKHGVKKFVNTGSVFEYGGQNKKVKERDVDLKDIINSYSAVKIATTVLANSYMDRLKVITLRPFTCYGPYEDESRMIRATITRALNNESIRIVNKVVRDFVYVGDVAVAYQNALECNFQSGEIINIGSGKKVVINDVAKLIKKLTNSNSDIAIDSTYKRNRESACWADIQRARLVLGWSPKTDIQSGLKVTIDWIKDNL